MLSPRCAQVRSGKEFPACAAHTKGINDVIFSEDGSGFLHCPGPAGAAKRAQRPSS